MGLYGIFDGGGIRKQNGHWQSSMDAMDDSWDFGVCFSQSVNLARLIRIRVFPTGVNPTTPYEFNGTDIIHPQKIKITARVDKVSAGGQFDGWIPFNRDDFPANDESILWDCNLYPVPINPSDPLSYFYIRNPVLSYPSELGVNKLGVPYCPDIVGNQGIYEIFTRTGLFGSFESKGTFNVRRSFGEASWSMEISNFPKDYYDLSQISCALYSRSVSIRGTICIYYKNW